MCDKTVIDKNIPAELNCRDTDDTKELLKHIFFTLFYTDNNIEFGNSDNIGLNPVATVDTFHSQFQLDIS